MYFHTLYSAGVCRAIDIGLAVFPQPGEFADLDLLMWLQLVMVEQPVLCTAPDVIARHELHRGLTYRAKPLVILCHQSLLPSVEAMLTQCRRLSRLMMRPEVGSIGAG